MLYLGLIGFGYLIKFKVGNSRKQNKCKNNQPRVKTYQLASFIELHDKKSNPNTIMNSGHSESLYCGTEPERLSAQSSSSRNPVMMLTYTAKSQVHQRLRFKPIKIWLSQIHSMMLLKNYRILIITAISRISAIMMCRARGWLSVCSMFVSALPGTFSQFTH